MALSRLKKTAIIVGPIILIALISIIVMAASSPLEIAGRGEVGMYITGIAFAKPYTPDENPSDMWCYYDGEYGSLRTASYSEWYSGESILNFGQHQFSGTTYIFDGDHNLYGMPTVEFRNIHYFTSDSVGNEKSTFQVTPIERTFYDIDSGKSIDITLYQSYVTQECSLDVRADIGGLDWSPRVIGVDVLRSGASETYGTYATRKLSTAIEYRELGGSICDFRVVMRVDINNWAVGNYVHIDPDNADLGNAVLWAEVTTANMEGVDHTEDWDNPTLWHGVTQNERLALYTSTEDALKKVNNIPERTVNNIQLADTLYPSIYVSLPFDVIPGNNLVTDGSGQVTDISIGDFFVELEITYCILTAYADPIDEGHGDIYITDTFEEDDPPIEPHGVKPAVEWFAKIWFYIKDKWWFWTIIGIIVIGGLTYIFGSGWITSIGKGIGSAAKGTASGIKGVFQGLRQKPKDN